MAGIFISYRRDDAAADALLIKEALTDHFRDRQKIFMDVDNTSFGGGQSESHLAAVRRATQS